MMATIEDYDSTPDAELHHGALDQEKALGHVVALFLSRNRLSYYQIQSPLVSQASWKVNPNETKALQNETTTSPEIVSLHIFWLSLPQASNFLLQLLGDFRIQFLIQLPQLHPFWHLCGIALEIYGSGTALSKENQVPLGPINSGPIEWRRKREGRRKIDFIQGSRCHVHTSCDEFRIDDIASKKIRNIHALVHFLIQGHIGGDETVSFFDKLEYPRNQFLLMKSCEKLSDLGIKGASSIKRLGVCTYGGVLELKNPYPWRR
ncbi:hypothetical protein VNO77_27751 [Canavalia gladiata]|uniref:Uncharacterized protein n=1 Tax=Canavalia gladiata TaxID=3824 RepID=A0AAN9KV81_CANGL